jgi:hypothetical protein
MSEQSGCACQRAGSAPAWTDPETDGRCRRCGEWPSYGPVEPVDPSQLTGEQVGELAGVIVNPQASAEDRRQALEALVRRQRDFEARRELRKLQRRERWRRILRPWRGEG